MPTAAQRPCAAPGCSVLVTSGRCQRHAQQREQQRGKVAARGYGYRWQKARTAYLALNPLCVVCQRAGIVRTATDVDHVVPHRGDAALMWDVANWQSLCHACHSIKTAREDGGFGRAGAVGSLETKAHDRKALFRARVQNRN